MRAKYYFTRHVDTDVPNPPDPMIPSPVIPPQAPHLAPQTPSSPTSNPLPITPPLRNTCSPKYKFQNPPYYGPENVYP